MIYSILFLLSMQTQKSHIVVPFAKVDSISSSHSLVHYKCAERWVKQGGFFPVTMDDAFVGIAECSHIDKNGWVHAKVWLNRRVGDEYTLRPRLKVARSEFKQDGCYWQINDADISGMVYTKNPARYD